MHLTGNDGYDSLVERISEVHREESIAVDRNSGNFSEYAVMKAVGDLPKSQLSVLTQVVAFLKSGDSLLS